MSEIINPQITGGSFEEGFIGAGQRKPSREKVLRFHEALVAFQRGKIGQEGFVRRLAETQSLSDFPLLFADIVDRTMLAGYQEKTTDLSAYVQFVTNSNLNPRKLNTVDGGEGVNPVVAELAPYPEVGLEEGEYSVTVKKYGSAFAYSLENFIQDGFGVLANSTPRRMGKKCRRTEESVITKAFATDAAIAAFFTDANLNVIKQSLFSGLGLSDDNTALGVMGIIDATKVMSQQRDSDGQPISIEGATVVYPSHLQVIVDTIKNALSYDIRNVNLGTGSNERIVTGPWMAGQLNWVPNAQLSVVGGTNKMTGWYLFANPGSSRPALVAARLRGYETPQLYMKASNAVAISGNGLTSAFDGSFENDSIQFKNRQFIGVSRIDPKMVVYSNGTGAA